MEKLLLIAGFISLVYFIIKILEMKYIDKEFKPLKNVIRDTVYVFISGFICLFVFFSFNGSINNFMDVITNTKNNDLKQTEVFTGEPEF
tara:strand:- start:1070 stop:1336 length:267 start_codon:yes stop_codon:yes gene_type:complete